MKTASVLSIVSCQVNAVQLELLPTHFDGIASNIRQMRILQIEFLDWHLMVLANSNNIEHAAVEIHTNYKTSLI